MITRTKSKPTIARLLKPGNEELLKAYALHIHRNCYNCVLNAFCKPDSWKTCIDCKKTRRKNKLQKYYF